MRKFSIYIITISLLVLSGCKDFLETESLSTSTVDNYYKTPQQAFSALVGCYDGLQAVWGGVGLPVVAEVISDNTFAGTGSTDADDYVMLDEFDKTKAPSFQSLL
jgi:hypothetical protein